MPWEHLYTYKMCTCMGMIYLDGIYALGTLTYLYNEHMGMIYLEGIYGLGILTYLYNEKPYH